MFGTGVSADPLRLRGVAEIYGFQDARGKTPRDPRLVAGESTGVFLVGGQSNAANYASSQYNPTNSTKVDQISIYDGGCYGYAEVPLGSDGTGGSIWGRLGDKLIAAGKYQRVVFVPYAIGGTALAHWIPGGQLNRRILVAARRARSVGLVITASLWQHGETDGQIGTSQATYQAGMNAMLGALGSDGFTFPWMVAKSTYITDATSPTIRAALAALVDGSAVLAGPDTDTLTGTTNRSDTTHFNAVGADAAASLWRDALVSAL